MESVSEELVTKVKDVLTDTLVPKDGSVKAIKSLAAELRLSEETLRTIRKRNSFSIDTMARLLLRKGIGPAEIEAFLLQPPPSPSEGELRWARVGEQLNDKEKILFADLVEDFLRRWGEIRD